MSKVFFVILFLLGSVSLAESQSYLTIDDAPGKVQKNYRKAQSELRIGNYENALECLGKVTAGKDIVIDAFILESEIYYRMGDLDASIASLKNAVKIDSSYQVTNLYTLGKLHEEKQDFENATHFYEAFLRNVPEQNRLAEKAAKNIAGLKEKKDLFEKQVDFQPERLGPEINQDASDESLPSFTVDNQMMVFTRRERGTENLYFSQRDSLGEWLPAQPMNEINTEQNEGAHTVSADGKTIIFTGCNRNDGFGSCDLYISEWINGKWSRPKNLGEQINTVSWDSQPSLSADGRILYFSSSRSGGKGGRDIWYSKKNENGKWNPPLNLGDPINTRGNEAAPHLHLDGNHLYFMSDGHGGMGDDDLFIAVRLQGQKWQKPENLGHPINTGNKEGALSVDPAGEYAYYTSDRNPSETDKPTGRNDIYRFPLPVHLRPKPVTYFYIKVVDAETNIQIPAQVEIFDPGNPEESMMFELNATQTSTLVPLQTGGEFGVHVMSDGYNFFSDHLDVSDFEAWKPIDKTIKLHKIEVVQREEVNAPVILQNVFFETASASLSSLSFFELNRLVALLRQNPTMKIELRGHTDNVGSKEENRKLSQDRAEAVYYYLILKEIPAQQLTFAGYGESIPVGDNDTEEGRRLNRRTEFLILNN